MISYAGAFPELAPWYIEAPVLPAESLATLARKGKGCCWELRSNGKVEAFGFWFGFRGFGLMFGLSSGVGAQRRYWP